MKERPNYFFHRLFAESENELAAYIRIREDENYLWVIAELPGSNEVSRMQEKYPDIKDRIVSMYDEKGNIRKDITLHEAL